MLDTAIKTYHIDRMYFKTFGSIVSSSIWSESSDVCKLWITLLALADRNGCVYGSPAGLSRIAAVPEDVVRAALEKFMSEDLSSSDLEREPERKGRRIAPLPNGGWQILNYEYYRDLGDADVRRAQVARATKAYRERKASVIIGDPEQSRVIPSDSYKTHIKDISGEERERRFAPPTIAQVKDYWTEASLKGEPEAFHDHFESNGWKVSGKAPMRSWKAAARSWSRNEGSFPSSENRPPKRSGIYIEPPLSERKW